jgi:hypothetical protein
VTSFEFSFFFLPLAERLVVLLNRPELEAADSTFQHAFIQQKQPCT